MGILGKIFSSGASKLVESVGNSIDKNITSKEEASKLKNEFHQLMADHEYRIESELTKRHKADMTSDSWLSKNIRPLVLAFTTIAFTTMTLTGTGVDYLEIWKNILIVVYMFYFSSRGLEKINMFKQSKDK